MKKILSLFIFVIANMVSSQTTTPGYYIDKENNTVNAEFIWQITRNTPNSFTILKDSKREILNQNSFSKVCINNEFTFFASSVQIDKHSHSLNFLEYNPQITTTQNDLILEEIVNGKISLYKYSDTQVTRFFYKIDNQEYVLLRYKPYLETIEGADYTRYNKEYLEQILNFTKENSLSLDLNLLRKTKYSETDLKEIFIKINSLLGYTYKKKSNEYSTYIKPFIQHYQFESGVNNGFGTFNFGTNNKLIYGLEAEFEFPYYKKLISITSNINYFSYSDSKKFTQVPTGMVYPKDFVINFNSSFVYSTWGIQFNIINRKTIKAFVSQPLFTIPLIGKSETKTTVENMTSNESYYINESPYGTSIGVQFKNVELAYRLGKNSLGFILKYSFKLNEKK